MNIDDSSFKLPQAQDWSDDDKKDAKQLLGDLDRMLVRPDGGMSATGALVLDALAEVCNPLMTPDVARGNFWRPYRDSQKRLSDFFSAWLEYNPAPAGLGPGYYIEFYDYLANTDAGLRLSNDNEEFKKWFVRFLDLRGRWINSTSSTSTLDDWKKYGGTEQHPFDINDYIVPDGGFKSFNQFFLRSVKPSLRPVCSQAGDEAVVAPCDGGVFYLTRGHTIGNAYRLPGKSDDVFELHEAIPGYGSSFVGGPLLDILLWFTDYHHFHAPVSGTVIHQGSYAGSYNYDFDNFDAIDPYAPSLPAGSDRVGWYKALGKHRRYVWIIRTEALGLVAMVAIGFWGVGSIVNAIDDGASVEKGQYMGHFGYGGSSIVLAFEPTMNLRFAVGDQPVMDSDTPRLMKVGECLGRGTPPLAWSSDNDD